MWEKLGGFGAYTGAGGGGFGGAYANREERSVSVCASLI